MRLGASAKNICIAVNLFGLHKNHMANDSSDQRDIFFSVALVCGMKLWYIRQIPIQRSDILGFFCLMSCRPCFQLEFT